MQDQRMTFRRSRQPQQADRLGFDIQETADKLGVSYMTIWRAIRDGQFPAVKVRDRIIIPTKALDMLFESAVQVGTLVDAAEWTAAWTAERVAGVA